MKTIKNNRVSRFVTVLGFAVSACALWGGVSDSTMVYVNAAGDGTNGLRVALQAPGGEWKNLDGGRILLWSEFGAWDFQGKRMEGLTVGREADGSFMARWGASDSGTIQATAGTPDLVNWHVQSYSHAPAEGFKADTVLTVDGKEAQGSLLRLSNDEIRAITDFIARDKRQAELNAETCANDYERYAGIGEPRLQVTIDATATKPISDKLVGIFFEDISRAADGGLYGELVQNRDFEYSEADQHRPVWGADYGWSSSLGKVRTDTTEPLHPNNPHYALLGVGERLTNGGFDGICLRKGEKYDLSLKVKAPLGCTFEAALVGRNGEPMGTTRLKAKAEEQWQEIRGTLTAKADCDSTALALTCTDIKGSKKDGGDEDVRVDMVSLFPRNTFKGRANGLRRDLAQALADLRPGFVRFPGGCVAHGDGLDDAYDWKGSVGPLEARRPLRNLWGYHQTRGLGYYEYFQFCEDIGAEPLPVLAAGVSCQHSHTPSHHTSDELTLRSQQDGVPMEEMRQYVQDFLDLVEFANGATDTPWGKVRAEMGHPEPFNLKYIGVGNEDMITDQFKARFKMIHDALRKAHPEITVVGTVGPYHQGSDYADGWEFAREEGVAIVDEHYYEQPGWFVNNRDFYDRYDREGPHVYLGEYAAHLSGRPANVETAFTEALYLTDVERNGDVVEMTSYAPLLAKEGHVNWRPDLIFFNNREAKPTVGYYVQQLFSLNKGDRYVGTRAELDSGAGAAASKRVGVSTVTDPDTGDYVVKMVNLLPCSTMAQVNIEGATIPAQRAKTLTLKGLPTETEAMPEEVEMEISGPAFEYSLPPYSLTVVRIRR